MIYYLVTLSKKSQKTNQKKKIDMQVGGMESEESEGDGVLRLVNPNTKTADLNSIKKFAKLKQTQKNAIRCRKYERSPQQFFKSTQC